MLTTIGLLTCVLSGWLADIEFLMRVEQTEYRNSKREPISRIVRDSDGKVVRLRLSHMQLSAKDFDAMGHIESLRQVALDHTNVTDADLRTLRTLPHLESLVLNSTEITDEALDEIRRFPALRSLCLGSVAVTPEAVDRLKMHFRAQGRRLGLGYSQRKAK